MPQQCVRSIIEYTPLDSRLKTLTLHKAQAGREFDSTPPWLLLMPNNVYKHRYTPLDRRRITLTLNKAQAGREFDSANIPIGGNISGPEPWLPSITTLEPPDVAPSPIFC